ncbi:MAG: hypothetical protein ABIJ81_02395 [Patescibacteria group bacterium]
MSTKLWISIVLLILGIIGILTLTDYWQLLAMVITGVGLILLIVSTIGRKSAPPPPAPDSY